MRSYARQVSCWSCGEVLDRATGVLEAEGKQPKDNDVSFCIRCGEFGIFDSNVTTGQRMPTDDEFDEIGHHPGCRKLRTAWLMARSEGMLNMKRK